MGKLYLLESDCKYKIGITTDCVKKRIKKLQTGNPHKIQLVWEKECSNYAWMEKYWHNVLAVKRLVGEWFELTTVDVVKIITSKKYCIFKGAGCEV